VLTGGEPIEELTGHFYRPTVLAGVTPEMPVTTEETFGPVLPMAAVEDVDEAVARANDSRYGLNASVWTRDVDRGERVARRLDAGTVFVNEHLYTFFLHATPWGGYGDSGGDFAHGRWGVDSVTRLRHVHVAAGEASLRAGRLADPWWFPYDAGTVERIADAMRFLYDERATARLRSAPSVLLSALRNR
jgi:acyl-CoA reductase-like NAD-dependent aldehyde dehydrogenase